MLNSKLLLNADLVVNYIQKETEEDWREEEEVSHG